jgi:glycosyltransferase involved in cell wall biosynthesis
MSRRKILFFISSLEQGGAERQMVELMRGLDPTRFETHLALCHATDHLGYTLPCGAPRSIEATLGPTPTSFARLVRIVREVAPDVIHSYMGYENLFARLAGRYTGLGKVVGSVRCTRMPRRDVFYEWATQPLVDALICNSVGIRDELVARARVPAARIDVIENGVDQQRFKPLDASERARARVAWRIEGRTALVVPGRVSEQKNQIAIVRALRAMKRSGTLPRDLVVLFAGRGSPPLYGEYVRRYADLARLDDSLRFEGIVTSIEVLVGAADGVLLPSHYEGLPNAVIEAMNCATLPIVSPAANTDHLVDDGATGLVCEDTSADAVVRAIMRFVAMTPEARNAMGRRAYEAARERFAVRRMVARTVEVYARVLGDPSLCAP